MMEFDGPLLFGLLAALGGGLLVGIERERSHAIPGTDLAIGMRTFTLVALLGTTAAILGDVVLCVAASAVTAFAMLGYWHKRNDDPGLTTEFALLATYMLAALAMTHAQLAAALFVLLTMMLAGKQPLHRFSRHVLNQEELSDALLLAASALIVLPLLPDHPVDPFAVLNPRKIWLLVVWVMAINSAGYIGLRALGSRRGLVLAGLFGGFVSSSATIASMGQRAKADPALAKTCVASGLLSNLATLVQLALILLVAAPVFLLHVASALFAAGLAAVAVSGIALLRAGGSRSGDTQLQHGRPFVISHALLFAGLVALALLASAALGKWFGTQGTYATAATIGLADVHAAAIAISQLVVDSTIGSDQATWALAIAFTANSILKCVAALTGGRPYFWPVLAGIAAINLALVLGLASRAA